MKIICPNREMVHMDTKIWFGKYLDRLLQSRCNNDVFFGEKIKKIQNTTLPDSGLLKYLAPLFLICYIFQVFKI